MQNDSEFLEAIFLNFGNTLYEHTDDSPKLKTWGNGIVFDLSLAGNIRDVSNRWYFCHGNP